jgi:hypothetical protein
MKPEPLLYLRPIERYEVPMVDIPNYDGQGKSWAQEVRDSMTMLRIVLWLVVGLLCWVGFRWFALRFLL